MDFGISNFMDYWKAAKQLYRYENKLEKLTKQISAGKGDVPALAAEAERWKRIVSIQREFIDAFHKAHMSTTTDA